MKKIIVIDNRGIQNHPNFSDFDFVEFLEKCDCPEHVEFNEYATAFIHNKNDVEVNWGKSNFDKVFIFSGDYENPVNVRGKNRIFNLTHQNGKNVAGHCFNLCAHAVR